MHHDLFFARIGRESRAKLAALDRSQAVVEFGLDGTILAANDTFLAAVGYSRDELVGRHHAILVEPAYAASDAYAAFWTDLRRGTFQRAEFKRVGKGGREVWLQATYNPIIDHAGRPYKIVKLATDVTAEVERNIDHAGQIAALHRSQGVIEFTLDGTVLGANANYLQTLGYGLDEIVGRPHGMFVDDDYRASPDYAAFWKRLAQGTYQTGTFRRRGKGGREIWIQASYNPIIDRDGRPIKIVKFATDITADVEDRTRRAGVQTSVGNDLSDIAAATSDVARQAAEAASRAASVLGKVQDVARGTDDLLAEAENLGGQAATTFSMSDRAVEEAKQTTAMISSLNGHASRIGEVVALIQGIAGQTNLLALNATIEAARAGEAGRGFTIVAQEVKELASQTKRATDQIAAQVLAVQDATHDAVDAIGSIQATVEQLNAMSSTVTVAIQRQEQVVRDMSSDMQAMSTSAGAINGSMSLIAAAAEVLDQSTQRVRTAAQALR